MKRSLNIEEMSFRQVEAHIKESSVLIVPIGGLEPVGEILPLGVSGMIVSSFAKELSKEFSLLQAPLISYGFATPFKAFEGVTGLRKETFLTALADIIRAAAGWGITEILFLDGTMHCNGLIEDALRKYKRKIPQTVSCRYYNWQHLPVLRAILKKHFVGLEEYWRSEAAITLLYEELTGIKIDEKRERGLVQKELFTKWKKRGLDPSKLRGYAPRATLSRWEKRETDCVLWKPLYDSLKNKICNDLEI